MCKIEMLLDCKLVRITYAMEIFEYGGLRIIGA